MFHDALIPVHDFLSRKRSSGNVPARPPEQARGMGGATVSLETLEDRNLLAFTPIGDPFQVDANLISSPESVAVAADAFGNYVVVWESHGFFGEENLTGRRYAADGTPLGDEFAIRDSSGAGRNPAVAMDADGDFIVVWHDFITDGIAEVRGSLFNREGIPVIQDFLIHTTATTGQVRVNPAVAMDADGNFVVAWENLSLDAILARRFFADGQANGSEFVIATDNAARLPAIDVDSTGNFIVVWQEEAFHTLDSFQILAQRFDGDGKALDQEPIFVGAALPTFGNSNPDVKLRDNGSYVVTWATNFYTDDEEPSTQVFVRRFGTDGQALGEAVQVNTQNSERTAFNGTRPKLALLPGGGFAVVFHNHVENQSSFHVFAREFDANGVADSPEFVVNTTLTTEHWGPAIALGSNGNGVIAWIEVNRSMENADVYARRMQGNAPPTTLGIEGIVVGEDSEDFHLLLEDYFDDFEDGPAGLTYTLVFVDPLAPFTASLKEDNTLVFQFFQDAWGGPHLVTIRATDSVDQFIEATFQVHVFPINDAPVLTGANELDAIHEDDFDNHGTLLLDILGEHVSDVDGFWFPGIAVTNVDNREGIWQYSTNAGETWTSFGAVSEEAALLLHASEGTRIRFRPNADFFGRPPGGVTFRAWDAYPQDSGFLADTRENGGTTRFSAEFATMTILVIGVNDAPTLDGSNDFDRIAQYDVENAGTLVADLIAGRAFDVDPDTELGIAVLGLDESEGSWEFSRDGGQSWQPFGEVGERNARLLAGNDLNRVRFVPRGAFVGAIAEGFLFVAWDQSTGEDGGIGDPFGDDGATAYGAQIGVARVFVLPRNTAPSIIAPDFQAGLVDSLIFIGQIRIDDPDAGDTPLEITIWVDSGTLTLARLEGLEFLNGDGVSDQAMKFLGTLPNINLALASVAYRGNPGFVGADALNIVVDDLSGWPSGTTDTRVVALAVRPRDEVPEGTITPIGPFIDGPQSFPNPRTPGMPVDTPSSNFPFVDTSAPGDPWTPGSNMTNGSRGGRDLGAGSMQFLNNADVADPITAFSFEPMDSPLHRRDGESRFGLAALQFRDAGVPKTIQQMLDTSGGWGMLLSQASAIGEGDDNVALVEKLLGDAATTTANMGGPQEEVDGGAIDALMSEMTEDGANAFAIGTKENDPRPPIAPRTVNGLSLNPSEGAVVVPLVLGAGASLRKRRRRKRSASS